MYNKVKYFLIVTLAVIITAIFAINVLKDFTADLYVIKLKNFSGNTIGDVLSDSRSQVDIYKPYASNTSKEIYTNVNIQSFFRYDILPIDDYTDELELDSTKTIYIKGDIVDVETTLDNMETNGLFIKETLPVNINLKSYENSLILILLLIIGIYILVYTSYINQKTKNITLHFMMGNKKQVIFNDIFYFNYKIVICILVIALLVNILLLWFVAMCLIILILLSNLLEYTTIIFIYHFRDLSSLVKGELIFKYLSEFNLFFKSLIKFITYFIVFIFFLLLPRYIDIITVNNYWKQVYEYNTIEDYNIDSNLAQDTYRYLEKNNDLAFIINYYTKSGLEDDGFYTPITNNFDIINQLNDSMIIVNYHYLELIGFDGIEQLNKDDNFLLIPNSAINLIDDINTGFENLHYQPVTNYKIVYYEDQSFYAYNQRNASNVYDVTLSFENPCVLVTNLANSDIMYYLNSDLDNFMYDPNKAQVPDLGDHLVRSKYSEYALIKNFTTFIMVIFFIAMFSLSLVSYKLQMTIQRNYFHLNKNYITIKRIFGQSFLVAYKNMLLFDVFCDIIIFISFIVLIIYSSHIYLIIPMFIVFILNFLLLIKSILQNEQDQIVDVIKGVNND